LAVKLRLRRMGKKKQPLYKVVAADARAPRDGKFLEAIGSYNPLTDPSTIELKEDRVLYWLNAGTQPTDTVRSLLSKKGITLKIDLMRRGLTENQIQAEMENWQKQNEAKAEVKSKSVSKKKAEADKKADAPAPAVSEEVSKEKAKEDSDIIEGTAEVKGAASDESPEKE
jgi:small subunit ribosomal protein S16